MMVDKHGGKRAPRSEALSKLRGTYLEVYADIAKELANA